MIKPRALVTAVFGDDYKKIAKISAPMLSAYAKRMKADFFILETRFFPNWHPYWEKLGIGRILTGYERAVWVDVDTIIHPNAPDIFEEVLPNGVSAFDEGRLFSDRASFMGKDAAFYGLENVLDRVRPFHYFNVGVMVATRAVRSLFLPPKQPKTDTIMPEQTYLNLRLAETAFPFNDLGIRWNGLHSLRGPEDRRDLWIVHYAGWPRTADWVETMTTQMKRDLENWK